MMKLCVLSLTAAIMASSVVPAKADLITPAMSRTYVNLDGYLMNSLAEESDSDTRIDEDVQAATIGPLVSAANLNVSVTDMLLEEQGSVSATWSSLTSGHVDFDNVGWTLTNDVEVGSSGGLNAYASWEYHFTGPDAPVTVVIDYDVSENGDHPFDFGAVGFALERFGVWGGTITGLDGIAITPGTSGTWTSTFPSLQGGAEAYGIRILVTGGSAGGLFAFQQASMNGSFDWSLSEGFTVPEPSTFALLGIGLVGLMAFRRR